MTVDGVMMRTDKGERSPLPKGVLPRGLSRVQAAAYVGVSPTTFDRGVKDRKFPKPFRVYGRVLWDLRKLDAAISAMDTEDAASGSLGQYGVVSEASQ